MTQVVTIRNVHIGEGIPKIIVPIVDQTRDSILEKAIVLEDMPVDAVEWRADFYQDVFDTDKVLATARSLRAVLPDMPLLFTLRTKAEGGEKDISTAGYIALNKAVAQSGAVDIMDVELFSGDETVRECICNIHEAGGYVIASSHDFSGTPAKEELVRRLRKMQDMDADILKIAVMPNSAEDVLTLLSATNEMYVKYAKRPLVTISMSSKGAISRLAGEFFGSSMTFGTAGQASAPGQIPVERLSSILHTLHKSGDL
ncbi:MAG: type I 3-dehydroquinate dehydratase [Clostridiaceae bacterium]